MLFLIVPLIAGIGFVLLSAFVLHVSFKQLKKSASAAQMQGNCKLKLLMRATAVVCIWLVMVIALSVGGLGRQAGWLPVVVTLLPIGMAIGFTFFSPTTGKWLRHVSLTGLTFIQSLRIPANLLLWVMFLWGSLSVQATFEGSNYDILAGLTAPVIALGALKNKVIMVLWNCFSLSLLLYFSATSLLAATTPLQQFYAAPGTDSLFRFPFILLPAFLSPAFIFMHLLSLRKLLGNGRSITD
jgi:hypothetical protein